MEEVLSNSVGIFKEGPNSYVLTFAEAVDEELSPAKKVKVVNESDEVQSKNQGKVFNIAPRKDLQNTNEIADSHGLHAIVERLKMTGNLYQENNNKVTNTSQVGDRHYARKRNNMVAPKLNIHRTENRSVPESATGNNLFSPNEIKIEPHIFNDGHTLESKEGGSLLRGAKLKLIKLEKTQPASKEVQSIKKLAKERTVIDNERVYSDVRRKLFLPDLWKKQWERNVQDNVDQFKHKAGNIHSPLKYAKENRRKRSSDDESVSMVTTEGTLVEMMNMAGNVEELICNLMQSTEALRKELGVCRKVVPTNFYNPPIDNVTSTIIKGIINCVQTG